MYLFLAGMMLLAEIARAELVFEWTAQQALRLARGSPVRLFGWVFALCIVVTAFFSNDATVVVLTPAVIAITTRARVLPLPFVFSCAFVANAASFVLPISNPANLVVYDGQLPPLGAWLAIYALPSIAGITATFVALRWFVRAELRGAYIDTQSNDEIVLRKRALVALSASALAMVGASSGGLPLGIVTAMVAVLALAIASTGETGASIATIRHIDYAILLFVAGLFVIIGTLDANGALASARGVLLTIGHFGEPFVRIMAAFGAAFLSNIFNNLPIGLTARYAFSGIELHQPVMPATLIGVDLGPNLAVTGSLATLLWLSALRKARIEMTPVRFFRAGLVVMPIALLLAVLALR